MAYRRSRSEVRSLAEHWQQWERRYGGTHALFGDTSPVWIGQQLENLPASRVLELGAGEGRIALDLARRGHRVTAVDISTTATSRMAEQARELGLTLEIVTGDALRWLDSPSANRSWDVAVMQCFSAGSREATRAVLSILADRAHALIMENAAIVTTPADVYETWSPAATAELVEAQISLTRVSTLSVSAQPSK